jgi:hypothetical protein
MTDRTKVKWNRWRGDSRSSFLIILSHVYRKGQSEKLIQGASDLEIHK